VATADSAAGTANGIPGMQVMITLDTILLMLGMLACNLGHVKQQNPYFEVLQATSQELIAGVPGGGRGITYRLTLKMITDRPVKFDAIWVAGKKLNVRTGNASQNSEFKSTKNDVVTLVASDYKRGPGIHARSGGGQPGAAPENPEKAPVAYEGAALLKFVVDGSEKYGAIPTITVLPTIYGQ
jgi:hypothetical protein